MKRIIAALALLPAVALADGTYTFSNVTFSDGVTTQLCQSVTMTTQGCTTVAHAFDQLSLGNVSQRGRVGTGDDVLIMGFIIPPGAARSVTIRARGPSLAQYGVVNPLLDPVLTVVDQTSGLVLDVNDDWTVPSDRTPAIIGSGQEPADSRESATVLTLQPGSYTAIVSGKFGSQGVAIAELFPR